MSGRIFAIGASMHGIEALCTLVGKLPADFPAPILVVQHLGSGSSGALPRILSRAGHLPAMHPIEPERIEPGRIYVAPPDHHMLVRPGYLQLSHGPRENHVRPAVDALFRSVARAYGSAVVGIVLTGELDDGTAGLLAIKDSGGIACVQDPEEAFAPSMPRSALAKVKVDHCCTLDEMAKTMTELAKDDPPETIEEAAGDGLLAIECRVAADGFRADDWRAFERHCHPTNFNCPHCRCPLFEIRDSRTLRFRCRAGHAFSADCLLIALTDARENQLASLGGSLVEESALGAPDAIAVAGRQYPGQLAARVNRTVRVRQRTARAVAAIAACPPLYLAHHWRHALTVAQEALCVVSMANPQADIEWNLTRRRNTWRVQS